MKKILLLLLFAMTNIIIVWSQTQPYQGIIYVTPTGAGTRSGDSWANATSSIDTAQNFAQLYSAVVWVAAGTYYGDTTSTSAFTMKNGVNVYGGFAGNEPADYDLTLRNFVTNATILDGQNARRVLFSNHFSTQTIWDGFTIQNGSISDYGAGAYLFSNTVLRHCVVRGNTAFVREGGGIYCYNATIEHCNIENNSCANNNGGGIYAGNSTISNCRITGNSAHYGGGVCASGTSVSDCYISDNTGTDGGGVYAYYAYPASNFIRCNITNNNAVYGGGVYEIRGNIYVQCYVTNNSATYGGGIYGGLVDIRSCLVANNTATSSGGGLNLTNTSSLRNCTIVRNASGEGGAGVHGNQYTTITNCIVWGNMCNGWANAFNSSSINCTYSAIEGNYAGVGNISLGNWNPPMFVNPSLTAGVLDSTENVDWHLHEGSPCINQGNNSTVIENFDMDGTARIKRETVDMGCYESDYYRLEVETIVNVPDSILTSPLSEVTVKFNKPIMDSTFNYQDMSLMCDSGTNLLDENLQVERLDSVTYKLHLNDYTQQSGLFVLTIQTNDITDEGGYTGLSAKQTQWIQSLTHYEDLSDTVCDSTDYVFHGEYLRSSGLYLDTLRNVFDRYDSVVYRLHLVVNYTTTGDTTAIACDSFTWHDSTYTQSGDYTTYMTNASGCDSIVTLHLTVNYTTYGDTTVIVCDSFDWYEHTGITQSCDSLTHTFTNIAGCDSVVTLHLMVNYTTYGDTTAIACNSFDWYEHTGITQSCDSLTHTFTNVAGCDSVVTLHLTIYNATSGVDEQTACDSYTWIDGVVYTESTNSPIYMLTNEAGCDSVVTLHLTINHSSASEITATACENYEWHGIVYIESGDYEHTLTAANGCDSVVTLHLTVNEDVATEFTITTADTCYIWNGQTYCASGDYTQNFETVDGCDSVVTLHLTITVGIDDYGLANSMKLYPNPTSDVVNVQLTINNEQLDGVSIQVFDVYGRLLEVINMADARGASLQTTQIDLSRYAKGVYFVKAASEGKVIAVRKVVKR